RFAQFILALPIRERTFKLQLPVRVIRVGRVKQTIDEDVLFEDMQRGIAFGSDGEVQRRSEEGVLIRVVKIVVREEILHIHSKSPICAGSQIPSVRVNLN